MSKYFGVMAGVAFFAMNFLAQGANLVMQSGPQQVVLMELYTSEGCSSCPPAEAWFSGLKNSSGLWKSFVPISFHVDYWDRLGWPDKYASAEFTARQRGYATEWRSDTVYTPELVSGGKESAGLALPKNPEADAGALQATLNEHRELTVVYTPTLPGTNWVAHVALLGCGLDTAVHAGENDGRTLRHDFVVLSLQSNPITGNGARITLETAKPGEKAIAVWITQGNQMTPVQATGGWLK